MFEDYATGMGSAYDEMYDDGSGLRTPYSQLQPGLQEMGQTELQSRVEALQSSYLDQGVTFDIGGEERAFPLDVLPRVIEMDQWATVEAGVQQRVHTLEKFLADVYDAGRVLQDGVVPRRVVTTSSHFHRQAAGIEPPNGVRIHVSGIDLIRDDAGEFRVLEDNVRVPSGVSYVMTNRRAIAAALPETFAEHRIRPVAGYPQKLLTALRAAAPAGVTDPNVVVLTPGVFNGAYFEHALLARTMGVELVEGRDLECRRGRVLMRTTQGLEPIHVIYRRVDDEFLDPVHKPVDGSGGKGIVIGPAATKPELDELRVKVMADPRAWIAQPVVQLSTVPTYVDGVLRPRHVDLRPFAVNDGNRVWVLPGGLTRVAMGEGELIVNSSRGGGSKDTWVLAGTGPLHHRAEPHAPATFPSSPQDVGPALESFSSQQDQQQQQGRRAPAGAEVPGC